MVSLVWRLIYKQQQNKLVHIKIKTFCASKGTIKKVKKVISEWEEVFAKHISNKGFVITIYKDLLQVKQNKDK